MGTVTLEKRLVDTGYVPGGTTICAPPKDWAAFTALAKVAYVFPSTKRMLLRVCVTTESCCVRAAGFALLSRLNCGRKPAPNARTPEYPFNRCVPPGRATCSWLRRDSLSEARVDATDRPRKIRSAACYKPGAMTSPARPWKYRIHNQGMAVSGPAKKGRASSNKRK